MLGGRRPAVRLEAPAVGLAVVVLDEGGVSDDAVGERDLRAGTTELGLEPVEEGDGGSPIPYLLVQGLFHFAEVGLVVGWS